MSDDVQQFNNQVNSIVNQIDASERESIQRALDLLQQLQTQVRAQIAQGGSNFTVAVYKQVERAIELDIDRFSQMLQAQLVGDMNSMAQLGQQLVDVPTAILAGPTMSISSNVAQVAAGYVPGLIRGLSNAANQAVAAVLRQTVLGVTSVEEAIQAIGKNLKDPGPFRGLGARAETIVRTEVLRVQAMAADQRMKANAPAVSRFGYSMKQSWLTADDDRVRPAHAAVDGFEVEVGKPFLVGGEELRYPRDPKGSPGNTINCRCVARPVVKKAA